MEKQTINLPEELIGEILYYLPLKSLFKLKLVSKSWRSLISSKSFINGHAKKSNTCVGLGRHKLMLSFDKSQKKFRQSIKSYRQPNCLGSFSLENELEDSIATSLGNHFMLKFGYDIEIEEIRILGSCNGLILIAINWVFLFLWNPFIGKIKEIPPGPFLWNCRYFICGFGYVEYRSDDYKVVCIKKEKPYRTYIYSSKSNSWKNIEDFDNGIFLLNDTGKFVNGRLHWLAVQENGDREIVALNLVKEKYEIVGRPKNYSKRVIPSLEDFGGYLSLIGLCNRLEDISGWVMMKYGVVESWTKIWTLSDFTDPRKQISQVMTTFCLNKNGDVAVAFGSNLLVVYGGENVLRKSRV
ncbi:hypothetical protein ACP275_14G035100 [Erythranthe tilingii]